MVKETIVHVARKSGGHRVRFEILPLFLLKIVLREMGYIEVQYTKIKSEKVECTCHSPKPRCACGAKAARTWGGRRTPVRSCGFESSLDTTATRSLLKKEREVE